MEGAVTETMSDGLTFQVVIWIIIGLAAGVLAWLATGERPGLAVCLVAGVAGAVVAGWALPALGLPLGGGWLGAIVASAIGAAVLLAVARMIRPA